MFQKMLDLHTHTDNSPDAEHSAMILCEHAVKRGLRGIAFTDHCEVDVYFEEHFDKMLRQSYFEIHKAKAVFTGALVVSIGVELGQASCDFALAERILNRYEFDIVLASLHALPGKQDFYFLDYAQQDVSRLLEDYFAELLKIARWNCFDSLAHLTYPLRYIRGKQKIPVDIKRYDDVIDEILKTLIQNGKALEINTSGLRDADIGETSPDFSIVKRFHDLGGEYITIGSDAHNWQNVGGKLTEGYQLAYDAGFRSSVLFQRHIPVSIDFT